MQTRSGDQEFDLVNSGADPLVILYFSIMIPWLESIMKWYLEVSLAEKYRNDRGSCLYGQTVLVNFDMIVTGLTRAPGDDVCPN